MLIRSASNLTAVTELQQIHPILKPSEEAGVPTRSSWEETEVHQVMFEKSWIKCYECNFLLGLSASSVLFDLEHLSFFSIYS